MTALLFVLLSLAVGPLIVAWAERGKRMREALDGFIFVSIAGLIVLDILPHLMEGLGWVALLVVALGLWGPSWLEHRFHSVAHGTHLAVVLVAGLGLAVHTLADGAVLSDAKNHGLALAVVLHRLPVVMTVWWLLQPTWGRRGALAVLAVMGLGTIAGFAAGAQWLGDGVVSYLVEALVAGSILHVVFNRPHLDPRLAAKPVSPRAEGLGNLLGMGFLLLVFGRGVEWTPAMQNVVERLVDLSLVAAPALLLGYLLAGVLSGLVSLESLTFLQRGSAARQSLGGMVVGLPMPVCSCGVVPLYRSFIDKGMPPAAAMAFLVATPELGLDAVIVSLPLLGLDMTLARVIAAAVIAWTVGAVIGSRVTMTGSAPASDCCHDHDHNDEAVRPQGLLEGLRYGFTELFDSTMPWLVAGLLIAAISAPLLAWVPTLQLPGVVEIAVFALLGMPVYVCATGSTPIVAMMLLSGVSPGAALAFLITGPATNVATFGMLSNLHGRKVAVAFALGVGLLAMLAGVLTNLFLPGDIATQIQPAAEAHGVQQLSLVVLALLAAFALIRRGARALLAELGGSHGIG